MAAVFADTNVLFPFSIMDLLLALSEDRLHTVLWTDALLGEWEDVYRQPIVNGAWVERELDVAKATANKLLARMERTGILRETTGFKRNRLFRYDEYVDVFDVPAT